MKKLIITTLLCIASFTSCKNITKINSNTNKAEIQNPVLQQIAFFEEQQSKGNLKISNKQFATTQKATLLNNTTETTKIYACTNTHMFKEPSLNCQSISIKENTVFEVDTTYENSTFYKVVANQEQETQLGQNYGFVQKAHFLDSQITSPTIILATNSKTNKKTELYIFNVTTKKFESTKTYLQENTKVKILDGYDANKTFTQISFQKNNGEINTFYVHTSCLEVKGISGQIIVAFSTVSALVVLTLVIFGVKRKKKKKQ